MKEFSILEWENRAERAWSAFGQLMRLDIYVKHKMETRGCSQMYSSK